VEGSGEGPTNSKVTRPALVLPMLMSKKTRLRFVSAIFDCIYVSVDVVVFDVEGRYVMRQEERQQAERWSTVKVVAADGF
jgi:hypothetical protein